MKTEKDLELDIKKEFQHEAPLSNETLHVSFSNGMLTISGTVDSQEKKRLAEAAAKRVAGEHLLINLIEVGINASRAKEDKEIERAVRDMIKWNSTINENRIRVKVKSGWVTLEGLVEWDYQKSKARHLAADIKGVQGVINLIKVQPKHSLYSEAEKNDSPVKRNFTHPELLAGPTFYNRRITDWPLFS
jgi:osmotically-inducible protein OsmY